MSDINSNTINAAYPLAGQDNSTQGFRDNFAAIKTALTLAHDEITQLETTAARLNADNDFNGGKLINAELSNVTVSATVSENPVTDTYEISWLEGQSQQWLIDGDCAFTVADWPAVPETNSGSLAVLDVYISKVADSTANTVSFTVNGAQMWISADYSGTVADDELRHYRLTSLDGGQNVMVSLVATYTAVL